METSLENKEVEPVEPVQMNVYQSNTYIKDLSWLHFDDELRVQEKQRVKDQQSCISYDQIYKQIRKLYLKLHLKKITFKIYAKSWNSN